MYEAKTCESCGRVLNENEGVWFDDAIYCSDCLEENTVICSHCGDRIWSRDNVGSDDTPLCRTCYDRHFTTCERCGAIIRENEAYYEGEDDDTPYCYDCHQRRRRERPIHDYYFKPEPIFRGDGLRYFGVELEIDGAGECNDAARQILRAADSEDEEYLYIKHDGSLDDGMELVTHPMTLDFHKSQMPWAAVLQKAITMDYISHQASTCGLHVHVNRDSLGSNEAEQDTVIARILYFVEKHWEELLKFSRRTPRQLERWASRYGYKECPKEILDHAKKGGLGRYTAVNVSNEHTIEFRMFRGTLKLNTVIATLQMVDRICSVAMALDDDQIRAMSWTTFVTGCTEPELVQYLKERRLYVNEIVESEVEL